MQDAGRVLRVGKTVAAAEADPCSVGVAPEQAAAAAEQGPVGRVDDHALRGDAVPLRRTGQALRPAIGDVPEPVVVRRGPHAPVGCPAQHQHPIHMCHFQRRIAGAHERKRPSANPRAAAAVGRKEAGRCSSL